MQMCSSASKKGTMQRKIKSAVAAVVIAVTSVDLSFAASDTPSPITRSVLEQSIQTLEASNTRSEVIQSLADVFEAAGTKTLLVRTKYKYVSKRASSAMARKPRLIQTINISKFNLQRIVNAINDKHRKLNNEWDQALGYASGELKRRADPLRTVDLGGLN
jgi:hypothetical protein